MPSSAPFLRARTMRQRRRWPFGFFAMRCPAVAGGWWWMSNTDASGALLRAAPFCQGWRRGTVSNDTIAPGGLVYSNCLSRDRPMAPLWIKTKDKPGGFPARHPEDDWLMLSGGFVV